MEVWDQEVAITNEELMRITFLILKNLFHASVSIFFFTLYFIQFINPYLQGFIPSYFYNSLYNHVLQNGQLKDGEWEGGRDTYHVHTNFWAFDYLFNIYEDIHVKQV